MEDVEGIWIGDNDTGLYQELVILDDGRGWFEYARVDYAEIAELTWRTSPPNRISFEYGETREIDEYEIVRNIPAESASYTYELINGKTLRFAPPYFGTRDYHRGDRNSPCKL